MEGLWQEAAAGPGQLGWDLGACGQDRTVPSPGSLGMAAPRECQMHTKASLSAVTAGPGGTGVTGLSSSSSVCHRVPHFMAG